MLFSEQIAKIGGRNLSMQWFDATVKAGTEDDHKAVAAWLASGRSSLEKALTGMHSALAEFMALPDADRNSLNPNAMTVALKADKAIKVAQAVLKNFFAQTKWPASSKAKEKFKQELDTLDKNMVVLTQIRASGEQRSLDIEGKEMKAPQKPEDVRPGPEWEVAKRALNAFHVARDQALAQKIAYANAKLKAKTLFTEYESSMKKISPTYAFHNFDWDAPDALEKIENDPMIKLALEKAGLR
jgi:hypothetical protein